MALFRVNYESAALRMRIGVNVIIPENKWGHSLKDRPEGYRYPTLWLLCGGGFDDSDWQRYSAIELYAAQHGVAVVMPGVYYTGYMDTKRGNYKYWTQITEELPDYLRRIFPLSDKREDNFVAGFSMGGYGAFKWAMKDPEMFAACGSFAGPIGIVPREPIGENEKIGEPCLRDTNYKEAFPTLWASFGSAAEVRNTSDDNLYMLEKRVSEGCELPAFYIAVGDKDPTAPDGYKVMDFMKEIGISFKDIRDHGYHDWEYCNRHIELFLNWIEIRNAFKMEVQ